MTWLFVVVAILIVAGAFLAVAGLLGELPAAEPDVRPDRIDDRVQFDVVVRGYRMDEVDQELGRLRQEIDRLRSDMESDGA